MRLSEATVHQLSFGGAPAGTGDLTWAQRAVWDFMRWLGPGDHYFNLVTTLTVEPGRGLGDVLATLRAAIERHESLRTTFPGYPDEPRQRVHGSGSLPVEIHPADGDPGAAAERLGRRLKGRSFAHHDEWPLRAGVVLDGGMPVRLVLVVSHLCVDGTGLLALRAELAGGPPARAPGTLALAAEETSDAGVRRSASAMRHWRAALDAAPPSLFDYPRRAPENPRFIGVTLVSPALAVATTRLAARLRCTGTAVLMAGVAALLGRCTGHDTVALQVIAGNRWTPELARAVAPLAQNGIFTLGLDGPTFHDTVRAAARRQISAFRAGGYDPRDLTAELTAARERLGAHVDREAFVNDVRRDTWDDPPPDADPWELRPATRLTVTDRWERLGVKAFFYFRPGAEVHLQADTGYLPRPVALALLSALEELVLRALHDPVPLDTLPGPEPVRRGDGWLRDGAGYVDVAAVRALVAGSALVQASRVVAEPGRVVAYVVPAGPITVAELHADLCRALGERTGVHTPGHYVLCAGDPSGPVLASGSGRPA